MIGMVYLVGAGPGDPGLLTLRGRECLHDADVVLYDRLVNPRILNEVPNGVELIDVGKSRGKRKFSQEDINSTLVQLAQDGNQVVRLKGGDPFIFGRGGEEGLALSSVGIPFEVVPGVSSVSSVPAFAGIPLTHRGISSSFMVLSGSNASVQEEHPVDWSLVAQFKGTLVILMGLKGLPEITEELLKFQKPRDTPVAVIQSGTLPTQRVITGTLDDISDKIKDSGLEPPVVTVIGEVVSLTDSLSLRSDCSLSGKRVLVTRDASQSGDLSRLLEQRGANPIQLPTIQITGPTNYRGLDQSLGQLQTYSWIIFTSINGVTEFFRRLFLFGKDSRELKGTKICAIGIATNKLLGSYGILADLVPTNFSSQDLVKAFEAYNITGSTILLPRSEIGTRVLPEQLEKMGALVEIVPVYKTVIPKHSKKFVHKIFETPMDVIIFASSSSVTNLMQMLEHNMAYIEGASIVCIGPTTATTAKELGLDVHVIAQNHTVEGIVEDLEEYFLNGSVS